MDNLVSHVLPTYGNICRISRRSIPVALPLSTKQPQPSGMLKSVDTVLCHQLSCQISQTRLLCPQLTFLRHACDRRCWSTTGRSRFQPMFPLSAAAVALMRIGEVGSTSRLPAATEAQPTSDTEWSTPTDYAVSQELLFTHVILSYMLEKWTNG